MTDAEKIFYKVWQESGMPAYFTVDAQFISTVITPAMESYAKKVNEELLGRFKMEQAIKWLRDKHKIHIIIIPTITGEFTFKLLDIQLDPANPIERPPYKEVSGCDYRTIEDALEAGFKEALVNFNLIYNDEITML